ncbi:MAG: hypothetical protein JWR01_791 [Subtercola sp.]|nr:hypothetical protein [Subtercola sp.]
MSSFLVILVIAAGALAWFTASLLVAIAFGRAVRRADLEHVGLRGRGRGQGQGQGQSQPQSQGQCMPVALRDPCPGLRRFTQSGVLREDAPPEWATLR